MYDWYQKQADLKKLRCLWPNR